MDAFQYDGYDLAHCGLTHCGLVMPYGEKDAWTNADLSSKVFCDIHPRAISQEVLLNLICKMCFGITHFWNYYPISQDQ